MHNDGECDHGTFCNDGTDCTDCGGATVSQVIETASTIVIVVIVVASFLGCVVLPLGILACYCLCCKKKPSTSAPTTAVAMTTMPVATATMPVATAVPVSATGGVVATAVVV